MPVTGTAQHTTNHPARGRGKTRLGGVNKGRGWWWARKTEESTSYYCPNVPFLPPDRGWGCAGARARLMAWFTALDAVKTAIASVNLDALHDNSASQPRQATFVDDDDYGGGVPTAVTSTSAAVSATAAGSACVPTMRAGADDDPFLADLRAAGVSLQPALPVPPPVPVAQQRAGGPGSSRSSRHGSSSGVDDGTVPELPRGTNADFASPVAVAAIATAAAAAATVTAPLPSQQSSSEWLQGPRSLVGSMGRLGTSVTNVFMGSGEGAPVVRRRLPCAPRVCGCGCGRCCPLPPPPSPPPLPSLFLLLLLLFSCAPLVPRRCAPFLHCPSPPSVLGGQSVIKAPEFTQGGVQLSSGLFGACSKRARPPVAVVDAAFCTTHCEWFVVVCSQVPSCSTLSPAPWRIRCVCVVGRGFPPCFPVPCSPFRDHPAVPLHTRWLTVPGSPFCSIKTATVHVHVKSRAI
jgi:hypothetical protein